MDPRVKKEIESARLLYAEYGRALSEDEQISRLLTRYKEAAIRTGEKMREIGIEKSCTECALDLDECCCFKGVEEKYDRIILLINLVMGVEIPESREIPGCCLFVGSRGCKMTARHYFCVHYLCPSLKALLGPSAVDDFQSVAGEELSCGWETEQAIRAWLKERGNKGI